MIGSRHVLFSPYRRVAVTATGLVVAGAAALGGPGTAAAASSVDCSTSNLQTAIDNAPAGGRLVVTGTCSGNFTIDKDLSLLGGGTAVLDGQNAGTTLSVSSGTVTVANLRITAGSAPDAGGGISNGDVSGTGTPGGTLTLRDSVVSGNSGRFFGGGISNTGSLTLQGTTVSDNSAGESGAGIANSGTVRVDQSTVSGNVASIVSGGGIVTFGGSVTLDDSAVTDNSVQGFAGLAGVGGGIAITKTVAGGDVTLRDSTVTGNTAALEGGGIFNEGGDATLDDSTVRGNTAGQNGGGIFFDTQFGGSVTLNTTTVTSNGPNNCFPAGSVAGCSG